MTQSARNDRDPLIPEELAQTVHEHLIALEVHFEYAEVSQADVAVFSGFAVARRGILFWITANHCLRHLKAMADSDEVRVLRVRWNDRFGHPDAVSIPTDLDAVLRWARGKEPPDIGLALPGQNVQDLIAANSHLRPLALHSAPPAGFDHVGYCIAGLPTEAVEVSRVDHRASWITSWTGNVAVITSHLDLEPGSESMPFGHAPVPDCMYGRIDTLGLIESIVGMSGGPVFRISRNGTQWHWQLAGVQSSWFAKQQIVRIAKIEPLVPVLDRMCDRIVGSFDA